MNYWELFDLQKDPREMRSVYAQSDYADVQQQLAAELARLRRELKVPDPDPEETIVKRGPGKAGKSGKSGGQKKAK